MSGEHHFETAEVRRIGKALGIDWETSGFTVEQFRTGMDVELEHGTHDPETNVTDDDPTLTAKIVWAHLKELADYYTRLEHLEAEARHDLLTTH